MPRARTRRLSAALRRPGGSLVTILAALAMATGASPVEQAPAPVGGAALGATTGVVTDLPPGAAPPPEAEAASYVVADLDSGAVLAAKAPHARLYPASTLKVLTALTLLPELDKAAVVQGSPAAAAVEGSKVGIEPGLSYSVDLLFTALLLQSGNDAATLLAETYGGVESAVAAMNEVAQSLQAHDTTVVNPTGLDEPEQLTSAYDLALIARAALRRDDFRAYLLTPTAQMPGRDGSSFQIQNENRLIASYPGAFGVKNGYTTLARHTFVGAAERDGRQLVVTVMRTEGRPEPTVAGLLDWAFTTADQARPVGELVGPAPEPTPSISAPTPGSRRSPEPARATPAVAPSPPTSGRAALAAVAVGGALVAVVTLGGHLVGRRRRRSAVVLGDLPE